MNLLVLYSKGALFVDMSLVVQYVDEANIQLLASMEIQSHTHSQSHEPNGSPLLINIFTKWLCGVNLNALDWK